MSSLVTSEPTSRIFAAAEALRASAWRGLSVFASTANVDSYVSLGDPPADCCDLLIVQVNDHGPDAKSQAVEMRSAAPSGIPLRSETLFTVSYWKACYPTVEIDGRTVVLPDPDAMHAANEELYAHGESMFNRVVCDYADGTLFPDATRCPRLAFGKLRPLGPNGGCAGWTFQVTGQVYA